MYLFDTFTNFLSGLGVPGRDKMTAHRYTKQIWTRDQLEASYQSDWICRKAIVIPAHDATREWRAWQAEQDQIEKLEATENRLRLQLKLQDALTKARLYGGCCMLMGIDGDMASELDPQTIKKDGLKFLHVLAPHQIVVEDLIKDITSPYYGQPAHYLLRDEQGKANDVKIHPSRMVRLLGLDTPDPMSNYGWGDPLLQVINDAVSAAGTVLGSVAAMIAEAKFDVVKIPGLTEIFSTSQGTERMIKRFSEANVAKSVINAVILDGEEEWQRIGVDFSGMPEVLQMYLQVAAGACDIPVTRFLGMSPAGLNATGESDLANYYDRIKSDQELRLAPALEKLDIAIQMSSLGKYDENIFYEWNSLWQMSEADRADIASKKAQTAKIDADSGLVPFEALVKGRCNQLVEDGTYPGLEAAIEEAIENQEAMTDEELLQMQAMGQQRMLAPPGASPPKPGTEGQVPQRAGDSRRLKKKITDREFDEAEHPRDEHGRWTSGGGSDESHAASINTAKVEIKTKAKVEAAAKKAKAQGIEPLKGSKADHPNTIATRNPTAKGSVKAYGQPDVASMKLDPKRFDHDVNLFRNDKFYSNFRKEDLKGDSDHAVRSVVDQMKSNLKFLYGYADKHTQVWYDGARALVDDRVKLWGYNDASVAGVYAALSPTKDWDQNVHIADMLLQTYKNHQGTVWSKEMDKKAETLWSKANQAIVKKVRNKTLGELETAAEKSVWIRTFDETHNKQEYRRVLPDGALGNIVRNKDGKPSKVVWQSLPAITNAVKALEANGNRDIISDAMGNAHKVRSFFNNILDPHSKNDDVTIDTHAVGAALLRQLSGATAPVLHNFGNAPMQADKPEGWEAAGKSTKTGLSGLYPVYAQAYREAAKELGIQARQLQSAVWVVKRDTFGKLSAKQETEVEQVWRDYHDGQGTLEDTQKRIATIIGLAHGRHHTNDEGQRDSGDEGELHRSRVGESAADMDGGIGARVARRLARLEPLRDARKQARIERDALAVWNEEKHERVPKGEGGGGRFGTTGIPKVWENAKAIAALAGRRLPNAEEQALKKKAEEAKKIKLDPEAIDVGGDEWNKQAALRLETEYQTAKPRLDELLASYEGEKKPKTPEELAEIEKLASELEGMEQEEEEPEEYDGPPPPEEWDMLSSDSQAQIEESYYESTFDSYLESEQNSWYESGGPLEDAKSNLAYNSQEFIVEALENYGESESKWEDVYTAEQLAAMTNLYYNGNGEGTGKLEVSWMDEKSLKPEFTKEMYLEYSTVLKSQFDVIGEKNAQDVQPPDYLAEQAKEFQSDNWGSNMDDGDKFSWAKNNTSIIDDLEKEYEAAYEAHQAGNKPVIGVPGQFDPLNKTSGDDYRRTQKIAREMSLDRALQVFKDRKIDIDESENTAKTELRRIDSELWSQWKASSTSEEGLLLQVVTAAELGGRLNLVTGIGGSVKIDPNKIVAQANRDYKKVGGYNGLKAYVRAKWETTQFLLDEAGMDELELYRGITLDNDKYEEAVRSHEMVEGHKKVPKLMVVRNGAASTSFNARVANDWGGDNRVVLRVHVPRTAAISVPAYGINVKSEQEVVVAGTAWKSWDAWLKKAPRFSDVKMAA